MTALEIVLEAAEARARQLLNEVDKYQSIGQRQLANEARRDHYEPLKQAIADVCADTPRPIGSMTLWDIVQALDGWGLTITDDDPLHEGFDNIHMDPDQEVPPRPDWRERT